MTKPPAPAAVRKRASTKGQSTRLAIMLAARTVFAHVGFARCEISQIAEAVGKGRGTFYVYFDSKTDLLQAMAELFLEDMRGPGGLATRRHRPEQVETVLRVIWSRFRDHAPTFRAMADAAIMNPEFDQKYRRLRAFAVQDFAEMIRTRQSQGACVGLDAELAGAALENMVNACLYDWLALRQIDWPNEAAEARAFETLLAIVQATLELPRGQQIATPGRRREGKT